jgi:hypothetical protein
LAAAVWAGLLAGCVERRFVINSDPPGAIVYQNGQALGKAPADNHFLYYGNYHFTLVHPGFQTLQVDQCVPAPWYEYPGLDFIAENLIPWTIRDVRRFTFTLEPLRLPNTKELLEQSQVLRGRGQAIPTAPPSPPLPAAPVPVPAAPLQPAP